MSKWNALTAAVLFSATMSVANAQQGAADSAATDTASMDEDQARMGDRDDADYGWLGLLGLAGLVGMKRRVRDDYRRDATAR
jgi:MYXO-CTERM domain-containing protein